MVRYEPFSEVKKIYHVSGPTLQKWAKKGHIRYKTIQNDVRKTWLYDVDSIGERLGGKQDEHQHRPDKGTVLYARVSSLHQKEDLERQKILLKTDYPDASLLSDIGSGLDYKRRNFTKLVKLICTQQISTVVATYRDRIARFGYEMFEEICKANEVRIVVLGGGNEGEEDELKEDLLSIVNVFVARRNGRRGQRLKRLRKEAERKSKSNSDSGETQKANSNQLDENKDISNADSEELLKSLFEGNRWAWNMVVESVGDDLWSSTIKDLKTKSRPCVKKINIDKTLTISKLPEEVFDSAFRDYFKARKTISSLYNEGHQKYLSTIGYKHRTDRSQSIEIRARTIKRNENGYGFSFYPMLFGKGKKNRSIIRTKEPIPLLNYSIRLVRKKSMYYLHIPCYHAHPPITPNMSQVTRHLVASIDPGVRTMLSGYDPQGRSFEIGTEPGYAHILTKQYAIDALQRKYTKARSSRMKMRYRDKMNHLYRRIKNCINDLHHKASKWLLERYDHIVIPAFGVKKMSQKENPTTGERRVFGKSTARKMLTWGHFQFRRILTAKADRYGSKIHLCTEEYTSKTCTKCGRLNHRLGASKWFSCPYNNCTHACDRDLNAARNILLKTY